MKSTIKYTPGRGYYVAKGGKRVSGHFNHQKDAQSAIKYAEELEARQKQSHPKSDS